MTSFFGARSALQLCDDLDLCTVAGQNWNLRCPVGWSLQWFLSGLVPPMRWNHVAWGLTSQILCCFGRRSFTRLQPRCCVSLRSPLLASRFRWLEELSDLGLKQIEGERPVYNTSLRLRLVFSFHKTSYYCYILQNSTRINMRVCIHNLTSANKTRGSVICRI